MTSELGLAVHKYHFDLVDPIELGLGVRAHQSGCMDAEDVACCGCRRQRRRSSLAAEVATPHIDPGSRLRAATILHDSICAQSTCLLGAKLN
jgi:hypothetical protein